MKKYKITKGNITQTIGNKITIFDGDNSVLYTLNETASFIFKKIKNRHDMNDITKALINRYAVDPNEAEKDVNKLISDLISKKIIEPA